MAYGSFLHEQKTMVTITMGEWQQQRQFDFDLDWSRPKWSAKNHLKRGNSTHTIPLFRTCTFKFNDPFVNIDFFSAAIGLLSLCFCGYFYFFKYLEKTLSSDTIAVRKCNYTKHRFFTIGLKKKSYKSSTKNGAQLKCLIFDDKYKLRRHLLIRISSSFNLRYESCHCFGGTQRHLSITILPVQRSNFKCIPREIRKWNHFSDVYSYFMMITRLIAEEHGADSATCSIGSAILGQKLTLKSDSECCRSCHWICRIIVARHFDHMECGGKWNDNLVVVFPARTIDLSPFWHFV